MSTTENKTPRKRTRRSSSKREEVKPKVPTAKQKQWSEAQGRLKEKKKYARTGDDEFAEVEHQEKLKTINATKALGVTPSSGRKSNRHVEKLLDKSIDLSNMPVAKQADSGEDTFEDQRVAQCEYMMLRGIEDPYAIKSTLGFHDVRIAKTFIKRVKMRWSLAGSEDKNRMEVARITAIRKLQLLQQKLWTMIDDGYNGKSLTTSERIKAMDSIEKLVMRVAEIEGVTKDTIVSIIQQSLSIGTDGAFQKAVDKNDMMKQMASRFEQLLSEKHIN